LPRPRRPHNASPQVYKEPVYNVRAVRDGAEDLRNSEINERS
jgi:hypothetical protein